MANATRGIIFLIIAVVIIGVFLYNLPHQLARLDKVNKDVEESAKQVELSKQRVAEAQARLDADLRAMN